MSTAPPMNAPVTPHSRTVEIQLDVMMFLQFFTWGAWFVTLGQCLESNGLSSVVGSSYGAAPISAMLAPLFLGLIADRFFPSQAVLGMLMLAGGVMLWLAPDFGTAGNLNLYYAMVLGHLLCFMPTLGLGNTIAFANLSDPNAFPRVRVWGTLGWIAAGLFVGFSGLSASLTIFKIAAGCSVLLGLYAFSLPHTPPPAKGQPINLNTLLMADAFGLLKSFPFLVFIVCSTLICIPLAYYYSQTSTLLGNLGFPAAAATMTLGQMSEVIFMLLIPFFFRRLGVKWMILIGMAAWVARYLLFAFGAPQSAIWMILLGVLMHGICYDFFFVTGFMYTEQKAPKSVRGQAQSLLVFFTQGVGMFFGFWVADLMKGRSVPQGPALNEAIAKARSSETPLTAIEQFQNMFSARMPEGVSSDLIAQTMPQWKEYWMLPAGMAAAIFVVFLVMFHEKRLPQSEPKMLEEPPVAL